MCSGEKAKEQKREMGIEILRERVKNWEPEKQKESDRESERRDGCRGKNNRNKYRETDSLNEFRWFSLYPKNGLIVQEMFENPFHRKRSQQRCLLRSQNNLCYRNVIHHVGSARKLFYIRYNKEDQILKSLVTWLKEKSDFTGSNT